MASDIYRVTTTGQAMLQRALRLLGATDAGEVLGAAELADGLETLNGMLDSWNTEKLNVYQMARQTAALTAGQQTRTIGPGGQLDLIRPQKIEEGEVFLTGAGLGTTEVPLEVYSQVEWGLITSKDVSGQPGAVYYEPAFPLGTMYFYPKPDAAYTFINFVWQLLSQVSSATASISLPSGYVNAIIWNLAIDLAPEYGASVTPEIAARAIQFKAAIKAMNTQPLYLELDPALQGAGTFDILTGTIR